jgi:PhzF family phenazine biosynthesis protein
MTRPFQLVDVFGATDFKGNPLAVVLDGAGLDTLQMQAITQWLNLSETAFLSPPTDPAADYKLRIFTLENELPFAGHPTLGSCHAWLSAGGQPKNADHVVQECGAGLVKIKRTKGENGADRLAFAAPSRTRTGPLDEATLDDACAALQITRSDIIAHEWLINGPTWAGVMLKDAAAVRAVKPLGSWPKHFDIGLVGLSDGPDIAYEVRAIFTNHNGTLVEDPVTGSLNAGVAQWLLGSGRVTAPYVAAQGTCIGRQGRIHISQTDGDIWVGGATKTLFSGMTAF